MVRRPMLLALVLGFVLGLALAPGLACNAPDPDSPPPEASSGPILSLSPLGTRALLALGIEDGIAVVDPESRALLPRALEPPHDPEAAPPRLALVPPFFERLPPEVDAWLARAEHIVVVDLHDFDDARDLYDEIASALGDPARAEATRRRVADLLGPIGAKSSGPERPCVVVVVDLDPLTLAGGHSFESNVLELLGAESATHDLSEDHRIAGDPETIRAAAPDLVLVSAEDPPTGALASLAADLAPLDVVPTGLDTAALWLGDRATAEPQLALWSSLVARARANAATSGRAGQAGERTNCRKSWGRGAVVDRS